MKESSFTITSIDLKSKIKKLNTTWTLEFTKDIKNMQIEDWINLIDKTLATEKQEFENFYDEEN